MEGHATGLGSSAPITEDFGRARHWAGLLCAFRRQLRAWLRSCPGGTLYCMEASLRLSPPTSGRPGGGGEEPGGRATGWRLLCAFHSRLWAWPVEEGLPPGRGLCPSFAALMAPARMRGRSGAPQWTEASLRRSQVVIASAALRRWRRGAVPDGLDEGTSARVAADCEPGPDAVIAVAEGRTTGREPFSTFHRRSRVWPLGGDGGARPARWMEASLRLSPLTRAWPRCGGEAHYWTKASLYLGWMRWRRGALLLCLSPLISGVARRRWVRTRRIQRSL